MAAIACDGLVAMEATEGHVDGATFLEFCGTSLIPEMTPFDDNLYSRSVVIMDNASVHHVAEVSALFADAGILLLFQPAYSPDFNVAEFLFSYVKRQLTNYCEEFNTSDPLPLNVFLIILRHAFTSVTADIVRQWAVHIGYS